MANMALVVPVATLSVISVCMFIFMCWFFPRYYKKGIEMDVMEIDELKRQRELRAQAPAEVLPAHVAPPPRYIPPVTSY